jgi:uncharacterized OB-fold protein
MATTEQAHQVPIEPGLFTWPADRPQLIGGRCRGCGVMTFPRQPDCPKCFGDDVEEALFDRRGTLWTFTTQQFVPKSPPYARQETEETFVPYAVGYVEFAGQARVEGRIDAPDLSALRIGMEMEVVVVPFLTDADGNEVVTYMFRPVDAGAAS